MEPPVFDVNDITSKPSSNGTTQEPVKEKKTRKPYDPYVKTSLWWLTRAKEISYRAAYIGNFLWFLKGVNRSNTVIIENTDYGYFLVRKRDCPEVFSQLAKEGLLTVQPEQNGRLVVTLITSKSESYQRKSKGD